MADENQTTQTPAWMLTFADLLSLVLTFFVLVYSMTSLQAPQWKAVQSSLSQTLNPDRYWSGIKLKADKTIQKVTAPKALDLDYLSSILTEKFANEPTLRGVKLQRQDDRIVISLSQDVLFPQSGAVLSENALRTITFLSDILSTISNRIEIQGNTDPTPVLSGDYPSNWELSLARAEAVAEELKKAGYRYKIMALGLADSRYFDLAKHNRNANEKTLYESARRVDIIIHEAQAEGMF